MEIEIKIKDDLAATRIKNDDGSVSLKRIDLTDFCSCLGGINVKNRYLVPPNCRAIYQNGKSLYYLSILPEFKGDYITKRWTNNDSEFIPTNEYCVRHLMYAKATDYRVYPIVYPATAALIHMTKDSTLDSNTGKLSNQCRMSFSNMYLWALKDAILPLEEMTAYIWPFANVFADFKVCIGSVLHRVEYVSQISSYHTMMFSGVANTDLINNARFTNVDGPLGNITDARMFIKKLVGSETFPVCYLVEAGNLLGLVDNLVADNR